MEDKTNTKECETKEFYELPDVLEDALTRDSDYLKKRANVIEAMKSIKIEEMDYLPFKFEDQNKLYTRNLVMETDLFSLIILVWNPRKESPVHDHPCDGCWVRVLEGQVQETVYDKNSSGDLEVTGEETYSED